MFCSKPLRRCVSSVFCRETLDQLYSFYNRREFIHPDPLEFVHQYADPIDREVVGMVASSLAYGRVYQILKSVSDVLNRMGESPSKFVLEHSLGSIRKVLKDFRHRFTGGDQLAALLYAVKRIIERHGSLHGAGRDHYRQRDAGARGHADRGA